MLPARVARCCSRPPPDCCLLILLMLLLIMPGEYLFDFRAMNVSVNNQTFLEVRTGCTMQFGPFLSYTVAAAAAAAAALFYCSGTSMTTISVQLVVATLTFLGCGMRGRGRARSLFLPSCHVTASLTPLPAQFYIDDGWSMAGPSEMEGALQQPPSTNSFRRFVCRHASRLPTAPMRSPRRH